ncbi:MAG: RNA polymerase sigma factor [Bacteroidota bacterium]
MQENSQHINQLIGSCKKGDQNAQFELYKLFYKAMYNTSYRILNDSFEAEDVMQEAFLNAFTKLDTYKGEVTFGAWLKRIVINRSLTQLRKIKRQDEMKFDDVENKIEVVEEDDYQDNIDYSDLKAKEIINTIQQLKENYCMALTLSLIEGYDNEEIAQIMQISNENCRTTISRAKNKLRQLLKPSLVN